MTQDTNVDAPAPIAAKSEAPYSPDDLIALIRAVKFAHPSMSQRDVHTEITGVIANSDPSCNFLKEVQLNDVKKVWKKALKGSHSNESDLSKGNNTASKKEPPILPPNNDGVLKLYTVGDGSVKTLAENYANQYARAAAEAERCNCDAEENNKYTHFFLDVPADRSGSRPHQALINFNDNKRGKKQKSRTNNSKEGNGREVFKIQMAASPRGMEDMALPMLLYNEDRSAKTFLHPPDDSTDSDDGGYTKIQEMIRNSGMSGALGNSGGQKAYFWGIVRELKDGEKRVVSVDVEELAPNQIW